MRNVRRRVRAEVLGCRKQLEPDDVAGWRVYVDKVTRALLRGRLRSFTFHQLDNPQVLAHLVSLAEQRGLSVLAGRHGKNSYRIIPRSALLLLHRARKSGRPVLVAVDFTTVEIRPAMDSSRSQSYLDSSVMSSQSPAPSDDHVSVAPVAKHDCGNKPFLTATRNPRSRDRVTRDPVTRDPVTRDRVTRDPRSPEEPNSTYTIRSEQELKRVRTLAKLLNVQVLEPVDLCPCRCVTQPRTLLLVGPTARLGEPCLCTGYQTENCLFNNLLYRIYKLLKFLNR
ncbi:hypothetical protein GNI_090880 [Gregarina niphandrodes]|uniref:Uncharacterized protein n=1 Tax=Gregarina niphandrodes TaxID=110365 RepID=A0A023B5G6_GRENI|nr:hypothetical protein GNI_090880 [Gregarina niphandrodes]EZG60245.1 hypothetical protein GNI_090880 [Gregarina niphandrodes]|eukprot:XP_011130848.1 hypothetical protein GNI_090880 [Gregarina niphandrodes]